MAYDYDKMTEVLLQNGELELAKGESDNFKPNIYRFKYRILETSSIIYSNHLHECFEFLKKHLLGGLKSQLPKGDDLPF